MILDRTAVKCRFEHPLLTLRTRLQSAPLNPAVLREVQDALTGLRKQLRLAGYDLSMGKYTLTFDGFKNDDAFGAFKRMVLFIDRSGLFFWLTGDDNHITQASLLEQRLIKTGNCYIVERHYLWFASTKTTLTLSGSATERPEEYEKLQKRGMADTLLFLSRLKGLC
jgi:hypothetical protein